MECDAKKKVIIKDLDGSFLGAIGTVLPDVNKDKYTSRFLNSNF